MVHQRDNGTTVPEGCIDQSFYHFFDNQNMVSESFSQSIDLGCLSTGLNASPYTIDNNEVAFEIVDALGTTMVTLEITEISTIELIGTLQFDFGGLDYKLIKEL